MPAIAGAAPASGQQWAVVNLKGKLVRSSGVTSAVRDATGEYEVVFASDVSQCAYEAMVGDPGDGSFQVPVEVTVASLNATANGVFVQTTEQVNGTPIDAPFHIKTYCGANANDAVVDGNGSLARGAHVVSAAHLTTGQYAVVFDHDVSKCAFTATIGTTANGEVMRPGVISVASSAEPDGVIVSTLSREGSPTDFPFHLAVDCGSKLFAVVRAKGTTARGASVVSSKRLSGTHGAYQVIFNRDVTACAYTATVGQTAAGTLVADPVTISTATREGNAHGVFVSIQHTGSVRPVNEPFHLVVTC